MKRRPGLLRMILQGWWFAAKGGTSRVLKDALAKARTGKWRRAKEHHEQLQAEQLSESPSVSNAEGSGDGQKS